MDEQNYHHNRIEQMFVPRLLIKEHAIKENIIHECIPFFGGFVIDC